MLFQYQNLVKTPQKIPSLAPLPTWALKGIQLSLPFNKSFHEPKSQS